MPEASAVSPGTSASRVATEMSKRVVSLGAPVVAQLEHRDEQVFDKRYGLWRLRALVANLGLQRDDVINIYIERTSSSAQHKEKAWP